MLLDTLIAQRVTADAPGTTLGRLACEVTGAAPVANWYRRRSLLSHTTHQHT
jgi:ribosomal protein L13